MEARVCVHGDHAEIYDDRVTVIYVDVFDVATKAVAANGHTNPFCVLA